MEDALSGEMARRRAQRPSGGRGQRERQLEDPGPRRDRPRSTGDVEPQFVRLPSRFAKNYQLDSSVRASTVRPHAPLSRTTATAAGGASPFTADEAEQEISRGLAALWNSLKSSGGGEGNVQFLNITDDDSYEFSSTKPTSAAASRAPFSIPESPRGSVLVFNIMSTWGDKFYLGLNGLEIFDMDGKLVQVAKISADPADINILPENRGDTRVVGNLLDGTNHTRDDMAHTWLCPFFPGRPHLITIELEQPTALSMIRVWQYNKDRVHANRGARYMEVSLDRRPIFKGEIKKASGVLNVLDSESCSECILFTTNIKVLAAIESNDRMAQAYTVAQLEAEESRAPADDRRQWGTTYLEIDDLDDDDDNDGVGGEEDDEEEGGGAAPGLERPMTGHRRTSSHQEQEEEKEVTEHGRRIYKRKQLNRALSVDLLRPSTAASARSQLPVRGRVLDLCLLSNWGEASLVGLTGLVGMDANLEEMPLGVPEVLLVEGDARLSVVGRVALVEPPSALVNGVNATTAVQHMWRTALPKQPGQQVALRFDLGRERDIKGLKVWNLNDGKEGACGGIKHAKIYLDGRLLSPTSLVIRKAPGRNDFDYSQFLPIQDKDALSNKGGHARSTADLPTVATHALALAQPPPLSPVKKRDGIWADLEEHGVYEDRGEDLEDAENSPSDDHDDGRHSFGQTTGLCLAPQQWATPVLPSGMIVKLVLLSTHGDADYIGLNGLTLLDGRGAAIPIACDLVQATPFRDVNCLLQQDLRQPKRTHDARCLENLTNGSPNDTFKDRYMWLAPLSRQPGEPNTLSILADRPLTLSCVKLFNYSKNKARGVKELEVYVDDVLVFRGSLHPSPEPGDMEETTGHWRWGTLEHPDLAQSVLFTNDAAILRAEASRIPSLEDDICFFDGGEQRIELPTVRPQARPQTAVSS